MRFWVCNLNVDIVTKRPLCEIGIILHDFKSNHDWKILKGKNGWPQERSSKQYIVLARWCGDVGYIMLCNHAMPSPRTSSISPTTSASSASILTWSSAKASTLMLACSRRATLTLASAMAASVSAFSFTEAASLAASDCFSSSSCRGCRIGGVSKVGYSERAWFGNRFLN